MSDLQLDLSINGYDSIQQIIDKLTTLTDSMQSAGKMSDTTAARLEYSFSNAVYKLTNALSDAAKTTKDFSASFSTLDKATQDQIVSLVASINHYRQQAIAIETGTKILDKHSAAVATSNHLETIAATKAVEAKNKQDLLNDSRYVASLRLAEANKGSEAAAIAADKYRNRLAAVTRDVEFYSAEEGKRLLRQEQVRKNLVDLATSSAKYSNALAMEAEKNKFLYSAEGQRTLRLEQNNKNISAAIVAHRKFAGEIEALERETQRLSTAQGQNYLISKQLNDNTKAAIVAEAKFAGEIEKQARLITQLSSEKGRQLLIDKQLQKNTEEAVTSSAKYAGALEKLERHEAYLATSEGQRALQLAQSNKNTERALTYNERLAGEIQKVAEMTKQLSSAEGQELVIAKQANKNKEEALALSSKLSNQLELERIRYDHLNSELGEEAAKLKALNALKQQAITEDATREGQLARIRRELEFENSENGRKLAIQKELLRQQKQFNAENAKAMLALSGGVGAQSPSATAIREWDRFRRSTVLAQQATAGMRAAFTGFGASFGIYTSSTIAFAAAVYGLSRALRTTITTGKDFENSMARTIAAMDMTQGSRLEVTSRVRDIAATTVFTATETAEGMKQLALAGLKAEDSMAALPASLRLASIGMLDMGTTADIVTNIIMGMGLQVANLPDVVDDMATAVVNSNMDIQQLGLAMSYVAPIARDADMSLQELTASLEILHNSGIKSQRAGTALRTSILSLMSPTKEASEIMDKYNIVMDDSSGVMRDWTTILESLYDANLSLSDVENLVGKRQASAFSTLIKSSAQVKIATGQYDEQGNAIMRVSTSLREMTQQLHNNSGASAAMQAIIEDTLDGDWKKLLAAVEEKMLEFYASNAEGLRKLVKGATDFVQALDVKQMDSFFQSAISGAKELLAVLVAAKSTMMFLNATSSIGNKGWGAAVKYAGAAAIGGGAYYYTKEAMNNASSTVFGSGSSDPVTRSGDYTDLRGKSDQDVRDIQRFYQENLKVISSRINELRASLDTLYLSERTAENLDNIATTRSELLSQEDALAKSTIKLANVTRVMKVDNIFASAKEASEAVDQTATQMERLLRLINSTAENDKFDALTTRMNKIRESYSTSPLTRNTLKGVETPEELVYMTKEERGQSKASKLGGGYGEAARELIEYLDRVQELVDFYDKVSDRNEKARQQTDLLTKPIEDSLKAMRGVGENKVSQIFSDLNVDLSKLYDVVDVYTQLESSSKEITRLESERSGQLAGAVLDQRKQLLEHEISLLSTIKENQRTDEQTLDLQRKQIELSEINSKLAEFKTLPSQEKSRQISKELLTLHGKDYSIRLKLFDASEKENKKLLEANNLVMEGLSDRQKLLDLESNKQFSFGKAVPDFFGSDLTIKALAEQRKIQLEIADAEKAYNDHRNMAVPTSVELLRIYNETNEQLKQGVAHQKETLSLSQQKLQTDIQASLVAMGTESSQRLAELKEERDIQADINYYLASGNLWIDEGAIALRRQVKEQEALVEMYLLQLNAQIALTKLKGESLNSPMLWAAEEALTQALDLLDLLKGREIEDTASKQLEARAKAFKSSVDSLYETINSSTLNWLQDGAKDSKTFFDGILQNFKDMLIEMAYEASIKPIVTQMFAGVIGGVFGEAAGKDFINSKGYGSQGNAPLGRNTGNPQLPNRDTGVQGGEDAALGAVSSIPVVGWVISAVGAVALGVSKYNEKQEAKADKQAALFIQQTQLTGTVLGRVNETSQSLVRLLEQFQGSTSSLNFALIELQRNIRYSARQPSFQDSGGWSAARRNGVNEYSRTGALGTYFGGAVSDKTIGASNFITNKMLNTYTLVGSQMGGLVGAVGGAIIDEVIKFGSKNTSGFVGQVFDELGRFGNSIAGGLFGTKKKVIDGGIQVNAQTLGEIMDEGFSGQEYTTVKKTKKKWGRKKVSVYKQFSDLDDGIEQALTDSFSSAADYMIGLAEVLELDFSGVDSAEKFVKSMNIKEQTISLEGQSGGQIEKILMDYFSSTLDDLSLQLAKGGDVEKFFIGIQQEGEGLLETMGRSAEYMLIWNDMAESLGSAMTATGMQGVYISQTLLEAAGGFENLMEQAATFFSEFYTDAEQFEAMSKGIANSLNDIGVEGFEFTADATRESFRELVNGLEYTGDESAYMYQQLLVLAPQMGKFIEYLEQLANVGTSLKLELLRAAKEDIAALVLQREKELEAVDPLFQEATMQLWLLQDLQTIYEDYNSALESSQTYLDDFTKRIQDFVTSLSITQKGLGSPLDIYAAAREEYEKTLALAKTGDKDALDSAISNAETYLDSVKNLYGSGEFAQAIIRRMKEELLELPSSITAEELLTNTIKDSTKDLIDYLEQSTGLQLDSLDAIKAALDDAIRYAINYDPIGDINDKVNSDIPKFAQGGVFTNSVVSRPTAFNMGLMGEAGAEAIMPLATTANGDLGVKMVLPNVSSVESDVNSGIIQTLLTLKEELRELRAENQQILAVIADNTAASVRVQQFGFSETIKTNQEIKATNAESARLQKMGNLSSGGSR
jgi:TP901 family phage tail tape measure protein